MPKVYIVQWFEPPHDKTNKVACAPSEDSDQPGHLLYPPSLIRVFAVRFMGSVWPKLSSCGQRRLIKLGAQVILLVLPWGGSNHYTMWTLGIQFSRRLQVCEDMTLISKNTAQCFCIGQLKLSDRFLKQFLVFGLKFAKVTTFADFLFLLRFVRLYIFSIVEMNMYL